MVALSPFPVAFSHTPAKAARPWVWG